MSAEKGGALVRSPPGLVDTYTHVGTGTKWGEQATAHITTPHKQLPQRNASVTKIPSGGYKDTSNNNKNNRSKTFLSIDNKASLQGKHKEDEEDNLHLNCHCGSWAKANQLEHDLDQLQKTHGIILDGLHQQLEEMKQKNRDLTFQVLMGPYANSVHVDIPLSPESDVAPAKEVIKMGTIQTIPEKFQESSKEQILSDDHQSQPLIEEKNFLSGHVQYTNGQRVRKARSGDPRQARSLDLEILEEESDELRKQLEEERAKNKYLLNLAEDLKRQIREETGTWMLPLNSKRIGQVAKPRDGRKLFSRDLGLNSNAIRLPQIPYIEQKTQLYDHQQQMHQNAEHAVIASKGSKRRKDGFKHSEKINDRTATTLPAIIYTGENHLKGRTEEQSNLKEDVTANFQTSTSKNKFQIKDRSKAQLSLKNHSKNKYLENISYTVHHNAYENYEQHKPYMETYLQSPIQPKNKENQERNHHQPNDQKYFNDQAELPHNQSIQHSLRKSTRQQSPTKLRSENIGNTSRARTISRDKICEENRMFQESNRVSLIGSPSKNSKVNLLMSVAEKPVLQNEISKQDKITNKLFVYDRNKSIDDSPSSQNLKGTMASSSSSVNSLGSINSKSKHRGRNNKRGGKKNKKDIHEHRDELQ